MSMMLCVQCGTACSAFSPRCEACGAELPDSSLPDPPTDARVGSRLGRFELIRRLGAGGMGVVYQARDGERSVALKLIAGEIAARPEVQARFMREARLAASLDHPSIGKIHDLERIDDELVIVMDYYEGETLKQRLARGALPVEEATALARQVASALWAAHQAGVVHRDVKPANVLLGEGGVKLLDFGLAKRLVADTRSLTSKGALLGTVAYMAPEQLAGDDVDARADLWALGVLLYEAVAGFPPFGARAKTAVGDPPVALSRAVGGVPRYLDALVAWLLERSPAARPDSMEQVLRVLETRRCRRRRPVRPWRPLAAVLALALGVGAYTTLRSTRAAPPSVARASMPRSDEAARSYERGLYLLARLDLRGARQALEAAVTREASFAPAHAALARACAQLSDETCARDQAAAAHSLELTRAQRLDVEGLQAELEQSWDIAIDRYRALFQFFPDDLETGLALADVETRGGHAKDAFVTVAALQRISGDPRIALAESKAAYEIVDAERARAAADRALRKSQGLGAQAISVRALIRRGVSRGQLGDHEGALTDLDQARVLADALGDRFLLGMLHTGVTQILYEKGDVAGARRAAEEAVAANRAHGTRANLATSLANLALIVAEQGDVEAARGVWAEAIGILRERGKPGGLMAALIPYGAILADAGDLDGGEQALREAVAIGRRIGDDRETVLAFSELGGIHLARGDLQAAEATRREAMTLAERLGDPRTQSHAEDGLAMALAAQGKIDEAVRLEEHALKLAGELHDDMLATEYRYQLAWFLRAGQPLRAAELSGQAADQFRANKMEHKELVARATRAWALALAGQSAETDAELGRARPLLDRVALPSRAIAAAQLARAELLLGRGEAARALLDGVPGKGLAAEQQLELRLVRAEISLRARQPGAREALRALAVEAQKTGQVETAREARQAADGALAAPRAIHAP